MSYLREAGGRVRDARVALVQQGADLARDPDGAAVHVPPPLLLHLPATANQIVLFYANIWENSQLEGGIYETRCGQVLQSF